MFDILRIRLVHGWLVDAALPEEVAAIGNLSYNQLVEKIIIQKNSPKPELVTEGNTAVPSKHDTFNAASSLHECHATTSF